MIGQGSNIQQLKTFFENKNKGFIIVHGDSLSGKNTIINETCTFDKSFVGDKVEDVENVLNSISSMSNKHLYYFEKCDYMNANLYNKLLKTTEDIKDNIFIVLEYTGNVPETLMTRCNLFIELKYNNDIIKGQTNNELIKNIASNIGQIKYFENIDLTKHNELVEKLYFNLGSTNTGNALKVKDVMKDFDIFTLLKILKVKVIQECKLGIQYDLYLDLIILINDTLVDIKDIRKDIDKVMDEFILKWRNIWTSYD